MTLNLVVTRTWNETPEIRCFQLASVDGSSLPAFEPGAHIDVKLPGQLVRQYSLWNGPHDGKQYLIGVKLEKESRGGSAAMHKLSEGDRLEAEAPRNNFPLAQPCGESLLLAGGVGITPLLSMAQYLKATDQPYKLHLFARSMEMAPFRKILEADPEASIHLGLIPPALDGVIGDLLAERRADSHVYICGPAPFMDLARNLAEKCGWGEANIHLEYFAASEDAVDTSGETFEVVLQRTGRTLVVREDQSILDAMNEAGIEILTSCEQGVCGTCVSTVLEGEPDHRDLYFNAAERASGKVITPCVSRCKGKRLVLDL